MLKDVSLAVQAGDAAKVALPLGSLAKELYAMVDLTGTGKKDFGFMMQFLRGNLSKGDDSKNSQ
jgi:3-hydroxyisobutyrate dehydrogenase-like beta-hydroxyacid dehydrogenase